MTLKKGVLKLEQFKQEHGTRLLIDTFFYSLAEDQGHYAIGVVLSGTGTDGSNGLMEIKKRNGLTIIQDQESSEYDGMPSSAQATCHADYILPPNKIPKVIIDYSRKDLSPPSNDVSNFDSEAKDELTAIYSILLNHSKHDFTHYKKNTILRRIERRMDSNHIKQIKDYVDLLLKNESEIDILFYELLIGVTSFFRDPQIFEKLQSSIIPSLTKRHKTDLPIRIWVAGCSSGEEVYSLAIIFLEALEKLKKNNLVQIFATDIDLKAINTARVGIYPKRIENNILPSILKKYFLIDKDGNYRVKQIIREMIIFANHNLIRDPPFTKIDMISCRNLLIYFDPALQNKLFPIFHYSLKDDGVLVLGASETIGTSSTLFSTIDKKAKIFKRMATKLMMSSFIKVPQLDSIKEMPYCGQSQFMKTAEDVNTLSLVEAILRKSNTAPCVLIDSSSNILYIHGRIAEYIAPAEGKINTNIIDMARTEIKQILATEIKKVQTSKNESTIQDILLPREDGFIKLDISVKPIHDHQIKSGHFLIVFKEKSVNVTNKPNNSDDDSTHIELELQNTRDALIATIDDLEQSNNELKNVNEELQSANEELQSANEELETSKEELQSLNEESITINSELQSRIDELSTYSDDMKNLLDSTDMATVFLDMNLCIRRFTPRTTDLIPLVANDVGRPISHFSTSLKNFDLNDMSKKVLDDLAIREFEIPKTDNSLFAVKFHPYRTINNVVDGVVITFEDITKRKKKEAEISINELRFRTFFELANDSMAVIDGDTMLFTDANENAYKHLGYTLKELLMLRISDIETQKSLTEVRNYLENIPINESFSFETEHRTKLGDIRKVQVKVKPLLFGQNKSYLCTWCDLPILIKIS